MLEKLTVIIHKRYYIAMLLDATIKHPCASDQTYLHQNYHKSCE